MSRWDFRSAQPTRSSRGTIGTLFRSAGLAAGFGKAKSRPAPNRLDQLLSESMERLEDRVFLAGDEPGFSQVFNTGTPLPVPEIILTAGVGVSATGMGSSVIGTAGDDDVFRFTAPANDFVRVWADSLATGSTLDSRVEIYTGTPGGPAVAVTSGSNNGTLTSGVFKDGWSGFLATAGTEYFIVVRSDVMSGLGSLGDYTLRINTLSVAFPTLSSGTGLGSIAGTIATRGSDVVYRVVTGPGAGFDGLATFQAKADAMDLDPRLDIYSAAGLPLGGDSDTGNLSDSYLALRSGQDKTFFVRVRSDRVGDPNQTPSTGAFTLVIDGIARNIALDPVTRLGASPTLSLADQTFSELFRFKAQGTGLSFITTNVNAGIPPLADSALRIYNDAGVQIGFNELQSAFSRLEIQLVGGQNYYVVLENFDGNAGGVYRIEVEAHHTFSTLQPIDDHASTPGAPYNATSPPAFGTPEYTALQRQFELATPLIWTTPQDAVTPNFMGLPTVATPDHSSVIIAKGTGRIHAAGETDLFQFVVPVDMLGAFPGRSTRDDNPAPPPGSALWRPDYRPATSLQILAYAETLFNASVRLIDSNFQQVYPNAGTNGNVLTGPYAADPAGALDPASFPPEMGVPVYGYTFAAGQPARIDVWAGEVYYLEISGAGSGRYNFEVMTDAQTDDEDVSTFGPMVANAGGFAEAPEIQINPNTGEGSNYTNAAGSTVIPLPDGSFIAAVPGVGTNSVQLGRTRAMNLNGPAQMAPLISNGTGAAVLDPLHGTPGTRGRVVFQISDLGIIQTATDTDLYQFRAIYTGTAEIRLNTTQLNDEYWEDIVQTEDGDPAPTSPPVIEDPVIKTKTYNSPLDGALRIFDNDQQEIAYNNDNSVTGGESDTRNVGTFGRTFQRRDPRVVIPVEAGKIYFVQVESGQRENFSLTFPKVDWRHAAGSYELLINSMPNLNFDDDHINGAGGNIQATPIPIDLNDPSTTAVLGSVPGRIQNTLANPVDSDLFTFFSPSRGIAKITLSTTFGDSFDRSLSVFDDAGALISQVTAVGTTDGVITVSAIQGQRFYVRVAGATTGDQGRYDIKVSGIPFSDDHASLPFVFGATEIPKNLYDFDKTETVPGSLENPGDSDIFQFETLAYDVATVTVTSLSAGLRPFVRVYEVGEDGAANPVLLQIAFNSATTQGGIAQINFSVTAPPRTSGGNGDTFNSYYVVVSGADPNFDFGAYTLTLTFNVATDDHPDATQYDIASEIALDPSGAGDSSGVIELAGDTDLFKFVSPSQGTTNVLITSPAGSLLYVGVRIFDENQQPVTDALTATVFVTGPDSSVSVAQFRFTSMRDQTYYIQVEGVPPFGNAFKTAEVGAYLVNVAAPIPDDHPNIGEFTIADEIVLSAFSGDGSDAGFIEIPEDTDLFKFVAIVDGSMTVIIDTPSSLFLPVLRLFDSTTAEIGSAVVSTTGSVSRNIPILAGETYYVLVSSDQSNPITTGGYTVTLDGTSPPLGPDDHANAGDYNAATLIILDPLTGDANAAGNIEITPDSDLFYFRSLAGSLSDPRKAYVQIVMPAGQALNVGLRIITLVNGTHTAIATSTTGGPGSKASVSFDITDVNKQYWIEVAGMGGTGVYTVRIDTAPETFYLYYPEGFANENIREYISIGNANNFAVNYTIRLRYESNDPERVITGTINPNTRGGVTISDGSVNPGSGVLFNKPYAIIVESEAFLGASISHYDFGNTLGEAFTGRTSATWSFAEAERFPGAARDFILYYNPNPNDVVVTLTAYQTDPNTGNVTTVAMSQTVQANRRFGWNVNATSMLPLGKFAFTLTSENAPSVPPGTKHIGIVAALSHNDLSKSTGYAVLGDPDGGTTTGVVPGIISTSTGEPLITFYNSSAVPATIGVIGKYINSGLPDLVTSVNLAPFTSRTYNAVQLGIVANQIVGLRYDANTAVTVLGASAQGGDSDATQGSTEAASSWFFGDGFMNRPLAGTLYFENMFFYNPDTASLPVTLNFRFNNGVTTSYNFVVGAKNFATVALHTLPAILNHAGLSWYSIDAVALRPFAASMNHYDLVLGGGWGTKGAPLGLTNPLSTI